MNVDRKKKRGSTMIDLISDTITMPSKEMMEQIWSAKLGDAGRLDSNGRGEDMTTNELEDLAAKITGKEAALFCPTGTMANVTALLAYCGPGDKVLIEERQHILKIEKVCFREDGFRMIPVTYRVGEDGSPDFEFFERTLDAEEIRLVTLENTHNFSGGTCMSLEAMKQIRGMTAERGIPIHMDGARIFNASLTLGVDVKELCDQVDSVMFCISKGLGAPIGSLLCGPKALIDKAGEWRSMLGGTMRESGVAAACGIYALEHNVERMREDHSNAALMAGLLKDMKVLKADPAPQSNILLFDLERAGITSQVFNERLKAKGVRCYLVSETVARMVFHLGITEEDTRAAAEVVLEIDRELLQEFSEKTCG